VIGLLKIESTEARNGERPRLIRCGEPPLGGRTGRGISIAVIDSGYHPGHPHIEQIAGGVEFNTAGEPSNDLVDRLGHGTAVTAAIQEKAPEADIHVVRVFHDMLAISSRTLATAIDWASESGCRIANLSLGTPHEFRVEDLAPAVERAVERGTIIVSAYELEKELWFPGSLSGALGVILDWDCPRDAIRIKTRSGRSIVAASGYPRPIPGVPPEHNLKGISFAVANTSGVLALALEDRPDVRTSDASIEALSP
jgi:hypothetical protein